MIVSLGRGEIIERLLELPPSSFENLVFDLVIAEGLRNAVWRTPGSDAGRDIEGEVVRSDLSGTLSIDKWYVECKRYASSLDWPTIWSKLAYADVQRARYFLVVTTSHLTPQCKSQVASWNSSGRQPVIRFWDASTLEGRIQNRPSILVKYGLSVDAEMVASSFVALGGDLAKTVQAAYGLAEARGQSTATLEAAAALAELLAVRLGEPDFVRLRRFSFFVAAEDGYPWLKGTDPTGHRFDRFGLRAAMTFVRHVLACKEIDLIPSEPDGLKVVLNPETKFPPSAIKTLNEIAMWGGIEFMVTDSQISFRPVVNDDA